MSRIASLRLQLIDSVSGPAKAAAENLRRLEQSIKKMGKDGVSGANKLGQRLDWLKEKSNVVVRFNSDRRGLANIYKDMRDARSNVARISESLAIASKQPKQFGAAIRVLKQDLKAADAQLRSTTAAFQNQKAAVKGAEQALRTYGINGAKAAAGAQQNLRNQMAQTIREMRNMDRAHRDAQKAADRQQATQKAIAKIEKERRDAAQREMQAARAQGGPGTGTAVGTVAAASGASLTKQGAQRGFGELLEWDQETRRQAAVGGLDEASKKTLNDQAKRLGQATAFTNPDIVRGQTVLITRGIRDINTVLHLTENMVNYAQAMKTNMEEAADTVVGSALTTRLDISDAKKVGEFTDFMVQMAKHSGMTNDDLKQFFKYGGASAVGAGLSPQTAGAVGMTLKNSGVPGDMAGVFVRSIVSKLVAPTNKGRTALSTLGIDHSKYATMPEKLGTSGIGILMKERFGLKLPQETIDLIDEALESKTFTDSATGEQMPIGSDAGEFTAAMIDLLGPQFGKGKDGKMAAKDRNALSKALMDFYKTSVESVDSEGLLKAILGSDKFGLGQANAIFTDKQGGRAMMLSQQFALFMDKIAKLNNVPTDLAKGIGDKTMAGVYGDWTRLKGTVETALLEAARVWEREISGVVKWTDGLVDSFINAEDATKKFIAAIAVAGGSLLGLAALKGGVDIIKGRGGGAGGPGGVIGGVGGVGGGVRGGPGTPIPGPGMTRSIFAGAGLIGMAASIPSEKDELLAFLKANHDATASLNQWLESHMGSPSSWRRYLFGEDKPAAGKSESAKAEAATIEGAMAPLDAAIASWPTKAQSAMLDYGEALAQGGAQAEMKAAAAAAAIKAELSFVAHPDVDTARLEAALAIARQVAQTLRAIGGKSGGGDIPNSNSWGGPRAHGGSVTAGKSYITGERGPEPFFPQQNGRIISNRQLRAAMAGGQQSAGGGVTVSAPITIKIDVNGASSADLAQAARNAAEQVASHIQASLNRAISRSTQVTFANTSYGDA